MVDRLSKKHRSWNMGRIKSKNTTPEKKVRSILHSMGYRFRLHKKDLPGKPDITLKKYKTVIFVHGCFWHHHKNCKDAGIPKSNKKFWKEKFKNNIERDKKYKRQLEKLGWKVLIIWACELQDIEKLKEKIGQKLVK